MKTYKGFLLTIEREPWGFYGTALGDNGEYLTLKMIGYNFKEMYSLMYKLVNDHLKGQ